MPELPEIETIKLQLQRILIGQKLVNFKIINPKTVLGSLDQLKGKKVSSIERKGKLLLLVFGPPSRKASEGQVLKLGFHFKMTGQLIYEDGKKRVVGGHPSEDFENKMPSKHTRAIFYFDPPSRKALGGQAKLYFNDQRLFGWIKINPDFAEKLGPEPFEMKETEFSARLVKIRRPIKIAIMDQAVISGVGNIYANDALWEARINPRTLASQLDDKSAGRLYNAICKVLKEGIKYGGASYANYVNAQGLGGRYQEHFRVYNREGEKCLRHDGEVIKKTTMAGRGTYFCSVCQK